MYTLGIDIGSTTVKVAVLDKDNKILFSDYKRHFANIKETLKDLVQEAKDALGENEVNPCITGSGGLALAQLIGELEDNKRGIYGGAIGYIDFTGNMDTCIAIRIAYKKNGKVFVRSGAGIVADSDPEKEFQECINKAKASLKALEVSQEVEE